MSSKQKLSENVARGRRPLLFVLVAGLLGVALTVGGGLLAQHRNVDQYAAEQVEHQIVWITNHPEPYDPAGEVPLSDWLADKVTRTGVDRAEMVFSMNSAGEDVTKLGADVPELAQSGLLLDPATRSQVLTPGEGRVSSHAGDFYYRTVNFNVGEESVPLASLLFLGGLEKVEDQTRNSMILIGLGGFLLLALVAGNVLAGRRGQVGEDVSDDAVASADRAEAGLRDAGSRGGPAKRQEGPKSVGVRRTSAMSDAQTAEFEMEPTEIRASGIWEWADDDSKGRRGN
ncbi:hypothetical protein [Trueperella bialowiezensis]|uniref:Uncharacterized protein n=1 Tax=Trueperella bialowiezensis TaxID=312285 RepID=A0A448PDX0_9ACTO|nr:hypothetical protein [Trueperella bialowiezensis]VEI13121.1 Uncharacterised protein [Trueperella bialowiezensis]